MRPVWSVSMTIMSIAMMFFMPASGQKKGNILEQGEDQIKMIAANQAFIRGDYNKALNTYKEVLKNKPNDADVLFHLGEVYLAMELYSDAQEHLEKSKSIDPKANTDLNFLLGKVYQGQDNLPSAIEHYTAFKTEHEGKSKQLEVDRLINQCKTAQELISKPVTAPISNMGDGINSSYDDKGPSITADGKTLVFTSRRPSGGKVKTKIDKEGDFKFFEDIYMSKWDDTKNGWGEAEVVKGSLNSDGYDACTSISPDGKTLYIYRNIPNETKSGDIFFSKQQASGKWGTPKPMPKVINTSYYEDGACISSDGNTLFFISERVSTKESKGIGQGDVWVSKKISKTEWGPPTNLGPEINTPNDENGLFLHPDGKTLFFCSNGHGTMGDYDIFMTKLEGGKWSKPVNLGYPINTTRRETRFVLSTDYNTAYISSNRDGGQGEMDVYKVDMSTYDIMGYRADRDAKPFLSILKGTVFNDAGQGTEGAKVLIKNKATGEVAGEVLTPEDGSYFFTLTGNTTYVIEVTKKDLDPKTEELLLKEGKKETYIEVKHFILSKPKKKDK